MAKRDGLTDTNPCEKVMKLREDNKRTHYLSPEEEQRLLAVLIGPRGHLQPIVLLAIQTRMRKGEILKFRWTEVDFVRGLIYVTRTKSGKDRFVPMNEVVRSELLALKAAAQSPEIVFVSPKTGNSLSWIKRGFAAACREAGVINLRFHDLRHTTGTRMADAGVDAFTIAEVLGHADLRMTARYTHATDQNKRRAVEKLASYGQSANDCHKIVTMEKKKAAS